MNQGVLRVTERTYTCPYKGTCNWVDYRAADGTVVRDVAWVYPRVKPGHEVIQGRFGFYAGTRGATRHGRGMRVDRPVPIGTSPRNLNSFGGEAIRAL